MSNTFRLQFLGPVQAEQDGKPLRGFRSRKALALLGYLAAQGQPLPRERLADMFWEDQSESRGRANLSWVLNKLNALLPNCLQADRHSVQYQRSDTYWLDLDAFDELEARGERGRASGDRGGNANSQALTAAKREQATPQNASSWSYKRFLLTLTMSAITQKRT